MTHEQADILEEIKAKHGELVRVPDDSPVLDECITDTYAFQCRACMCIFVVEPDGEVGIWAPMPLVD